MALWGIFFVSNTLWGGEKKKDSCSGSQRRNRFYCCILLCGIWQKRLCFRLKFIVRKKKTFLTKKKKFMHHSFPFQTWNRIFRSVHLHFAVYKIFEKKRLKTFDYKFNQIFFWKVATSKKSKKKRSFQLQNVFFSFKKLKNTPSFHQRLRIDPHVHFFFWKFSNKRKIINMWAIKIFLRKKNARRQ